MTEFLILRVLLYVIHVYGLENLALGKPTWEQNPWPGLNLGFGAANAVDGRYDNRAATGNQCTISDDGKYTAEWRVDLGKLVSICYIVIYFRTENYKYPSVFNRRMAGFSLYVSNTTSKEDGLLCFDDMKASSHPPLEDQNITCSVLGRYVIYYNERSSTVTYPINKFSEFAYNELCELEVYGCNGTYGDDCFYPCLVNCLDKQCNTETGQCYDCVPGYRGQDCSKVCNNYTYGPECAFSCGNCSNRETCHNVNGSCSNGCNFGTRGDTCHKRCQSGYYGRNCSQRCSQNCYVTSQCDGFTGQCEGGCKQGWKGNTCYRIKRTSSCTESYKSILIVTVVISVLSVLTGSLIDVVIWKRNVAKFSRMWRGNMSQSQNKPGTIKEHKDKQYADLEEIEKCKTYEEIHSYSNLNHKQYNSEEIQRI